MKKLLFVMVLFVATDLFAVSVTPPTRSAEETLATLIATHSLIVLGVVGPKGNAYYGAYPAFSQEQKVILSDVRINIQKVLQGTLTQKTILVQTPGGCIEADNLCFQTDLALSLPQGKQVILFLKPGEQGKWVIRDLFSGVQTYSNGLFYPLAMDLASIQAATR